MGAKLGDVVYAKSRQDRFPDAGRVVALLDVDFFEKTMCQDSQMTDGWDSVYPGWRSECLAMVYYDDPQHAMTLQEWVTAGIEEGYEEAQCEADYEEMAPKTQQVIFPLQDLDVGEWTIPGGE